MLEADNKNKVHSISLAQYSPQNYSEGEDNKGVVHYGNDNNFPLYLAELHETTPVHGPLCTSLATMISGKGFETKDAKLNQRVIAHGLSDLLPKVGSDLKIYGGFFTEIIYSTDRKTVAKIKYHPYHWCRLGIDKTTGEVVGVWISRDWTSTGKVRNRPVFVPRFNPAFKEEQPNQILFTQLPVVGNGYYAKPDYWPAVNYLELARQIGIYHVNNILNGFFPSFMVSFFNGVPDEESQRGVRRSFEKSASGAKNAGKMLITFNESGVTPPKVDLMPMTDADKQYDLLNKQSVSHIMVAHRVTTPRLFGIGDTGNGLSSNTDEMKQGLEILNTQVIKPYQSLICKHFETIYQAESINGTLEIIPNAPIDFMSDEHTGVNAASLALNGAQIDSLINIILQVATGVLTPETGRAVMKAGFPQLKKKQLDDIFETVIPASVNPTEVLQSVVRFRKIMMSNEYISSDTPVSEPPVVAPKLSAEPGAELIALGEDVPNGYFILDAYKVNDDDDDAENASLESVNLSVSAGTARPNAKSEQDKKIDNKLFITRYRYKGESSDNTRAFCKNMVSANKLYRKEDIVQMENRAVNPGWGPKGSDTYNIFYFKGGGECHHFWQKEVYVSAEGLGIDVNNHNARKEAVAKAEKQGYKVRNEKQVAQLPVDMPFNGFLPDNPRFN
jgi:hypothetical protein